MNVSRPYSARDNNYRDRRSTVRLSININRFFNSTSIILVSIVSNTREFLSKCANYAILSP